MTEIPVLAVRQPWASLIAEGHKTIEVRSRNTLKRGQFAIYASRTKPTGWCRKVSNGEIRDLDKLPTGQIIAVANLYNSLIAPTESDFTYFSDRHLLTSKYYVPDKTCMWFLSDIQKAEPVDFKFQKGQVVWSKIDDSKLKVIE